VNFVISYDMGLPIVRSFTKVWKVLGSELLTIKGWIDTILPQQKSEVRIAHVNSTYLVRQIWQR
jgi:hypothetical protein